MDNYFKEVVFLESEVMIATRFCGPPESGNGGYVSGLLADKLVRAGAVKSSVEVRLHVPPPLEKPLKIKVEEEQAFMLDGETLVAQASISPLPLDIPNMPGEKELANAREYVFDHEAHLLPTCFVCGPHRAVGDGLRIFSAPVSKQVAAFWTPDASLSDGTTRDLVNNEFVWAALDCSGYNAHQVRELMLLGTMSAQIYAQPKVGEEYIVVGEQLSVQGRKYASMTAIFDKSGRCYAASRQLWIRLKSG